MNLTIIKHDGGAYIDSREIAEFIGKRHRTLIRDIFGYIKYMRNFTRFNFEPSDFFVESTYTDNFGFKQTCYLVSKVGCELLMNRLNGEKANEREEIIVKIVRYNKGGEIHEVDYKGTSTKATKEVILKTFYKNREKDGEEVGDVVIIESTKEHFCKYCGQVAEGKDKNVLCQECRECFGHTFFTEL